MRTNAEPFNCGLVQMTNSKAKIVWMYLLFWMLNSKLSSEFPGFFYSPALLFVKVREGGEFWRGADSTFLKIQLKSFTRKEGRTGKRARERKKKERKKGERKKERKEKRGKGISDPFISLSTSHTPLRHYFFRIYNRSFRRRLQVL